MVMKLQHLKNWIEFWKTSVQPQRGDHNQEEWLSNGSVDVRGRPVLRTKSGGWKASIFLMVLSFTDGLTGFALSSNLIIYLTTVLREGVAESVKNINYWTGVTATVYLTGAFIADAYCGAYWMVFMCSVIYLLGLVLLTLSASLSALKPPDQCDGICSKATSTQVGVFFLALYLVAMGTGGVKPSLEGFGADQFDEEDKTEMQKKNSFFNVWYFVLSASVLLAVTVVPYVQENISWGFGFGILTVAMVIGTVVFLCGTPFYRHWPPRGSQVSRIAQVVIAAIRKRNTSMPSDVNVLYEEMESIKSGRRLLSHTNNFQFLDKAAIAVQDSSEWSIDKQGNYRKPNPWKLCTVTQVEETKLILRVVPIWVCCLMFGMTVTQSMSLFVKQGSTMDRRLGSHFRVPPSSLVGIGNFGGLVFVTLYDRCIVPVARRITGNERGITVLQRIGIGMLLSVMCMITAALTEEKRVHAAKSHGLLDSPRSVIPLSIFWLTPQCILMGIAGVFTLVGMQEYFYGEVPDSMRNLGIALSESILGVSSFLGSLVITIVQRASKGSWFVNNLNRSKLDNFYWLLAILSAINLCCYVYVTRIHTYKKVAMQQIISYTSSSP